MKHLSRMFYVVLFALGSQAAFADAHIPGERSDAFLEFRDQIFQQFKENLSAPEYGDDYLDDNEIWIDGEIIRYYASAINEDGDLGNVEEALEKLQGVRMVRDDMHTFISVYMDEATDVVMSTKSEAENFKPYEIRIPKVTRLVITAAEDQIYAAMLGKRSELLKFMIKVPYLRDLIYLRSAAADMVTGDAEVEVGYLMNVIGIVGDAQIHERDFKGVNIEKTLKKNLGEYVGDLSYRLYQWAKGLANAMAMSRGDLKAL